MIVWSRKIHVLSNGKELKRPYQARWNAIGTWADKMDGGLDENEYDAMYGAMLLINRSDFGRKNDLRDPTQSSKV